MQTLSPPEKTATGLDRTLFGIRNRHLFALDLLTFCVTPILALWLRIENWNAIWQYADALLVYILIAGILRFIIFRPFGLYSRYWRYASVDELAQIFFAVFVSSFTVIVIFFGLAVLPLEPCLNLQPLTSNLQSPNSNLQSLISNLQPPICNLSSILSSLSALPRSVPFLDGGLALIAVGGSRFSVRLMERYRQRGRKHAATTKRVAIIGAGSAGTMIAKEMQNNPQLGLEPVVFLDDDPRKQGMVIRGIRVVGDGQFICNAVDEYRIQQAIIAMPTAAGKTIRELTQLCRNANIPVQTVPGIFELLDGSVTVNQLRPVDITDLLRRESVVADITGVFRWLEGRRVLVTGAGGSIGGELCRQIARCNPAELVLLGHGENSIFDIYNELRRGEVGSGKLEVGSEKVEVGSEKVEVGSGKWKVGSGGLTSNFRLPTSHFFPVIADIRDECRMQSVFERYQPEIVFHAGAHKHVPLMEENAADAITNNVLGTRNLLRCAAAYGVEHLVLISSDKAVNPTSVMGTTKRIAELLVHETAVQTGRCYVAVRFGNVLGSRGSVIPFFKQQIAQGGPVTVTHPDVKRYFMTIPEAVELVLQAATMGKVGDVFVLDMGEPIKIVDLARDLIRLSGLEVGQDIEIEYTGLRPGEKLFEELFISEENCASTSHEKIFVVRNGVQPFGGSAGADSAQGGPLTSHFALPTSNLQLQVDELIAAARSGDEGEIRRKLKEIVPEYQLPDLEEAVAVPPVVDVVPPEREAVPSERALVFRVAGAEGD